MLRDELMSSNALTPPRQPASPSSNPPHAAFCGGKLKANAHLLHSDDRLGHRGLSLGLRCHFCVVREAGGEKGGNC